MDRVEGDAATQQTIEMLVELSIDSLDAIAFALSGLLDQLSKVSSIIMSKEVDAIFFIRQSTHILDILPSRSFNLNFSF